MRREMSYSQLWLIEREFDSLPTTFPGIYFLMETRIDSFRKRNKLNLETLHKKVHAIQKRYIVHDEKNVPQRIGGDGENANEWKYMESCVGDNGQLLTGDMVKEEYGKNVEEFLNRVINVEL